MKGRAATGVSRGKTGALATFPIRIVAYIIATNVADSAFDDCVGLTGFTAGAANRK